MPERDLAQADTSLEGVGDAGGRERRLERGPQAVEGRAHDPDLLRCRAVAHEPQDLVGDELERPPRPGRLEEAHGALERRRIGPLTLAEERPLEMRERRMGDLRVRGRQLLHPPVREAGQVGGRPAERGEGGASGLVRERDGHVRPAGERLNQGPLRAGQVLEAVREHGPALPGGELALDALDGVPALEVAVGELELLELLAIGTVERRQVPGGFVRVDEPGLELGDRGQKRLAEAG